MPAPGNVPRWPNQPRSLLQAAVLYGVQHKVGGRIV